jgi:DNA-binding transcriptional regulator/RsmH inhibitor MraZ
MKFLNWRTDAELQQIIDNDSFDYDIRIHATKELIAREKIKKLIMVLVNRKRVEVW